MNPLQESSLNRVVNTPQNDKETQVQTPTKKIIRKIPTIHDSLKVSQSVISFGGVIPGNIVEQDFQVTNVTTNTLIVQIMIVCLNREYDDLEEYVYSARKKTKYDYNDKILIGIQPGSTASFKIALKVFSILAPNEKQFKKINGMIVIQAQGLEQTIIQGAIKVPLTSQLYIPSISCPKLLTSKQDDCDLIQVAFKAGKKFDCKIQFKNTSQLPLDVESGLLAELPEDFPYQFSLNTINPKVQPNSQFFLNISLKPKEQKQLSCEARQILVIKCKSSQVYFSFPLVIKVCE